MYGNYTYSSRHLKSYVCFFWCQIMFIGFVCRTETMHQLLCFKSEFSDHFAFTLGRFLFMLFLVNFI
jgi:hypothetical protein